MCSDFWSYTVLVIHVVLLKAIKFYACLFHMPDVTGLYEGNKDLVKFYFIHIKNIDLWFSFMSNCVLQVHCLCDHHFAQFFLVWPDYINLKIIWWLAPSHKRTLFLKISNFSIGYLQIRYWSSTVSKVRGKCHSNTVARGSWHPCITHLGQGFN